MAVTLKDVARRAETSISAASAVLNSGGGKSTRVGPQTRARIMAAAADLGYVGNPIARSLATGRTGVIGLTLPYDSNFLFPDPWVQMVMNGAVSELMRRSYNLLLYTASGGHFEDDTLREHPELERGKVYDISKLVDTRVDGLIVLLAPTNDAIFAECKRRGIPMVSILKAVANEDELVVNSNDYEGARLAMDHLFSLGHERIAHLSGFALVASSKDRARGFRDAFAERGLDFDPMLIVPSGFNREDGYKSMKLVLAMEDRPTAVFCCSDVCAHGAIDAIKESGLQVPRDISVVGFDDTYYSQIVDPPLTTVNIQAEQLGMRAVRLLIAQVEGREVTEKHPVLPVVLSVRESTGPKKRCNP